MWWSKKDPDGDDKSNNKKVPPTPEQNKNGRRITPKQMSARFLRQRKTADATITASMSEESVCLDATTSAIEVSLPNGEEPADNKSLPKASSKSSNSTRASPRAVIPTNSADRGCAPFSSVSDVLSERRKVYRAQFAISECKEKSQSSQNTNPNPVSFRDFKPRHHRVPLFGKDQQLNRENSVLVQDAIALLRQHDVSDELECVKHELSLLDLEITSLQSDRADIEKRTLSLAISPSKLQKDGGEDDEDTPRSLQWETGRKLLNKNLPEVERILLQDARGTALTIALHNGAAREAFLSQCEYKASNPDSKNRFVTLSPHFCAPGGAASTIQHVSLFKGSGESSFLISRDHTKSMFYGRFPDRLFRRMHTHGMDPKRDAGELLYLSTGPLGCYYAEFRSGECWWGASVDGEQDDDEFGTLCREWDVSRVAFGPSVSVADSQGRVYHATSWIIVARDGRAAWKNLPSRLHRALEGRMASEAAPMEVSLGYGDSYFCRFLDGSMDYCLPAHVADVIEKRQLDVTSVYMHPDLPQDVVLRHR